MSAKLKLGTHAYGTIVEEAYLEVCDEYGSPEIPTEEIYRIYGGKITANWPAEATEKEIRKLAAEAMRKILTEAGFKKE